MHREEKRYSSRTQSQYQLEMSVHMCPPLPLYYGKRAPDNYWNNKVMVKPNTV